MSIYLFVLSVIGRVLLVLLLIVLCLVLVILFCPIRYEAKGRIRDPAEHEEFELDRLKEGLFGSFHFSWLFSLIGGGIGYPDETTFRFRIAWKKFTLDEIKQKREDKKKQKKRPDNEAQAQLDADKKEEETAKPADPKPDREQEKKKEADPKKEESEEPRKRKKQKEKQSRKPDGKKWKIPDPFEILDRIQEKIEGLLEKAESTKKTIHRWLKLLEQESTKRAVEEVLKALGKVLRVILPKKWYLKGSVGLGDPDLTGTFLEAIALTFPLTAGHVAITPKFTSIQTDLDFEAKGSIILLPVIVAALRFWFNKDVRLLRQRIRKLRAGA